MSTIAIITNKFSAVDQAWQAGQEYGVTHFWVMPGSSVDQMGQRFFDVGPQYNLFITSDSEVNPKFARCRKIGDPGHEIYIGYPHRGRFNWRVQTAQDIRDTVEALEAQLGVDVEWSSGHMARELLRLIAPAAHIRDTTEDLRDLPFSESARAIVWRRDLELWMIGKTVHRFDKNSAFLSAARGVKTGIGDPIHRVESFGWDAANDNLPGIYRVTVDTLQWLTLNSIFPPIIEPSQEWVTNDVLQFALAHGYKLSIHEAWVFPEYAKVLDKWAGKIWEARQALKGVNENAYNTMKEIALVGVGGFATNKQSQASHKLIHPNWWADVVGKSRVNMLANIEKYSREAAPPVLIETDDLYFVTRDPNPRTAVPGILERVGQSGGYKHEFSFTLTREIYDQAQGLDAGELAELFKKAAGVK